jgi:transmembrane sensor
VAKHKPAPFEVYAGDRRITAVGTLFDVRLDRGGISVALIEGRIRVAQIEGDPRRVENGDAEILLAAGEVLDTRAGGPMRVRQADLTRIDSWKDGVLEFDDEPLAEAVRELNRYNVRPIVLKDRALANLRVTGVFKTGAPDRFAQTMAEIFPIEARTGDDGALILSSKSSY